jgi:catechol 2,3-dioxygenase-like lactoylglutathione lyase family enzyme
MLDHVGLLVSDYERSKRFYTGALAPLGYSLLMEFGTTGGFGANGKPDFWISQGDPAHAVHVAFVAADRQLVNAFHTSALASGGRDNGPSGPRPQYHAAYYGAFVLDPDGNNVEAVCHRPE